MNSNAISIAAIIVSLVSILYANHVSNNLQETDDLIKHMVDYDFASAEAIKGLQDIAGELCTLGKRCEPLYYEEGYPKCTLKEENGFIIQSCGKGELLTREELIAR